MSKNGVIIIIKIWLRQKMTFKSSSPYLSHLSIYGRGIFQRKENTMSKLRGYRVMLGLTQQQMADKLNISLQSYNNKETKKTSFNDKERLAIKSMVAEIKPDITIDELFYN